MARLCALDRRRRRTLALDPLLPRPAAHALNLNASRNHSKEYAMNEDQIKGKAKEIAGETQEHVGRALGNRDQEAKGHAKEMEGKVQKKVGDVEEAVKDVVKKP